MHYHVTMGVDDGGRCQEGAWEQICWKNKPQCRFAVLYNTQRHLLGHIVELLSQYAKAMS